MRLQILFGWGVTILVTGVLIGVGAFVALNVTCPVSNWACLF